MRSSVPRQAPYTEPPLEATEFGVLVGVVVRNGFGPGTGGKSPSRPGLVVSCDSLLQRGQGLARRPTVDREPSAALGVH